MAKLPRIVHRRRDDVTYFHEAAIARRLDTVLVANRVLLVGPTSSPTALCIARGVPSGTSQGTAAVLEEADVTRQLLRASGLPVPSWRTLRFSDPLMSAHEQARELGFPLRLRPAWASRALAEVATPDELEGAVASLRQAAGRTGLRPGKPQSRYMAEAVAGRMQLQFLIAYGQVLAAAIVDDGTVLIRVEQVHSDFQELAIGAAGAIPDLDVATVLVTADDVRKPPTGQAHAVTRVSAQPRLAGYDRAESGLGSRLAGLILESEANRASIAVRGSESLRTVGFTVGGLPAVDAAASAFVEHLRVSKKLQGGQDEINADGELRGTITGSPADLARLADAAISGGIGKLRPLRVEIRHADGEI